MNMEEIKGGTMNDQLKRFCADCKTTRTPLWRSGPFGPRSLCNACGIRYRKRKSAHNSINPEINSEKSCSSSISTDDQQIHEMNDSGKEMIIRRPFTSSSSSSSSLSSSQLKKQRSRRERSISSDSSWKFSEVEEAAVLLMSLSCGSVFA